MVKKSNAMYVVIGWKLLAAIACTELLIMVFSRVLSVEKWLSPLQFDLADNALKNREFVLYYQPYVDTDTSILD